MLKLRELAVEKKKIQILTAPILEDAIEAYILGLGEWILDTFCYGP